MKKTIVFLKWTLLSSVIVIAIGIVMGIGGVQIPISDTEISDMKPFSELIGREYRVIANVNAIFWNDFPNKEKILTITLTPPPGTKNRFVSKSIPLQNGQMVRIVSAWRQFAIFDSIKYYQVLAPGMDFPAGVPIKMVVNSDGIPDPLIYELIMK